MAKPTSTSVLIETITMQLAKRAAEALLKGDIDTLAEIASGLDNLAISVHATIAQGDIKLLSESFDIAHRRQRQEAAKVCAEFTKRKGKPN